MAERWLMRVERDHAQQPLRASSQAAPGVARSPIAGCPPTCLAAPQFPFKASTLGAGGAITTVALKGLPEREMGRQREHRKCAPVSGS